MENQQGAGDRFGQIRSLREMAQRDPDYIPYGARVESEFKVDQRSEFPESSLIADQSDDLARQARHRIYSLFTDAELLQRRLVCRVFLEEINGFYGQTETVQLFRDRSNYTQLYQPSLMRHNIFPLVKVFNNTATVMNTVSLFVEDLKKFEDGKLLKRFKRMKTLVVCHELPPVRQPDETTYEEVLERRAASPQLHDEMPLNRKLNLAALPIRDLVVYGVKYIGSTGILTFNPVLFHRSRNEHSIKRYHLVEPSVEAVRDLENTARDGFRITFCSPRIREFPRPLPEEPWTQPPHGLIEIIIYTAPEPQPVVGQ